jgi:hypothetical protein
MSLVFDEFGRPYIILREQEKKARLKGLEAQKANIIAARLVSNVARSSLGPKGMLPSVCLKFDVVLLCRDAQLRVFRRKRSLFYVNAVRSPSFWDSFGTSGPVDWQPSVG